MEALWTPIDNTYNPIEFKLQFDELSELFEFGM